MSELIKNTNRGGESLTERIQYAKALADAGLLPQSYQRQPANVLAAIEYGDALGIHPMTAINEINVISGKPALSASLMQSLARAAGHKVRVTGDAERAVCQIIRKDDPDHVHESEWTRQKAEASKLWGKGHWAKDPALMLKWRAISECVRLACSEVLGGLKYTPEEVREFTGSEERPARWGDTAPSPAPEPQGGSEQHQGHPPGAGGGDATETAEAEHVQEPTADPDPVDARITEAWHDVDALRKIHKWLSNGKPGDPRLGMIAQRGQELNRAATIHDDREVVDAEIVDDPAPEQAETLPIQ